MALAILAAGALGATLPIALLQVIGVSFGKGFLPWTLVQAGVAIAGGLTGVVGTSVVGARLNDRIRDIRAPIGRAAIGADGIRWWSFRRMEFIAWSSVRNVEASRTDVVVYREAGNAVLAVQEAHLFASAAREALARYRSGEASETIAALEFTEENVADWLGRARALLEPGAYRDADVGEERCVRVAIDPRAPIAQRIGSAAALSKGSDEARQRVRVAIEETADPEVANALEDALESRGERAIAGALTTRK